MISLDGSTGGGQLLRTALSLSALLQKPFRMTGIRGAREKGGLKAQHLTAVNAVAKICGASVKGAALGSTELSFEPGRVQAGTYAFDIGTAGSTTLLLQTLWPVLSFASRSSSLVVRGGTAVAWSPSSTYVERVFLPLVRRTGARISLHTAQWGFYPRGGGELRSIVQPVRTLRGLDLGERGALTAIEGISTVANLPVAVAERENMEVEKILAAHSLRARRLEARAVRARDLGNECYVHARYANTLAGFSALGERGKRAAKIAAEATNAFFAFHAADAVLDEHAADQILLYAALASGESGFSTPAVTEHLRTNQAVIEAFLGPCVKWTEEGGRADVRVRGAGIKGARA